MNRSGNLAKPLSIHFFLVVIALVNLSPVYYVIINSLKSDPSEVVADPFGLPARPTVANFVVLPLQYRFLRLFANSCVVTVVSVLVALAAAILAAYAFARIRFWGRSVLFNLVTALMAIPVIVVIIPLFVLMSDLRLINTYASPVIVYAGFILPFAVFILTSFFRSVPQELIDAARMDGAGDLTILIRVVLPLAKAPLATLAIVNGLWVWNDLLIAVLFLQREEMKTLMAGLASFSGRQSVNIPLIMAASLFASAPTVILLVVGQKQFVKGLTSGAVK